MNETPNTTPRKFQVQHIQINTAGNFRCCLSYFHEKMHKLTMTNVLEEGHTLTCPYCHEKNVLDENGIFNWLSE